jgi:hypothetical protein
MVNHINGLTAIEATLWHPPGMAGPLPTGSWREARWIPGAGYGADIDIKASTQRFFVNLA